MRQAGIWNARRSARACVTRLGISAPEHIRIDAIATRLAERRGFKLRILEGPLDGADSQLVRLPRELVIIVADRIKDPASRKFIIGHELGHVMLDHPFSPPHRIGDAPTTGADHRDYEAEANTFASELTMPYILVRELCRAAPVTLDVPWQIARAFGMSILAAARRVAELSPECCAAVFCAHAKVVWCAESTTFTIPIERHRPLAPCSVAARFWQDGEIAEHAQRVPAHAWLPTTATATVLEHATASREFRTVLSVLWVPARAAAPLGMGIANNRRAHTFEPIADRQ